MYFGIDVGGSKMLFASFDDHQVNIIERVTTPQNYEEFVLIIKKTLNQFINQHNEEVEGIGIGVPGRVVGNEITWVPNLLFLNGKNLTEDLLSQLGVDVIVANDAQLALLGETWCGAGRKKSDAILISLGTGVGGAIMAGGKILRGNTGTAGSFGWINLDVNEETENHGYLELHTSGKALERRASELNPNFTSYDIVKKAKEGEESSLQIINHIGDLLGASIATLVSILDPEIVIISGGLSEIYDVFSHSVQKKFKQLASPSVQNVKIVVTELKNKAAVFGAIRLAISGKDMWV